MNQYLIENNILTLKVKKSPLFILIVMYLFSFLFFILPIMGLTFALVNGSDFHIGFLFGIFFFGLMGFYLLRLTLWNTFGKELLIFNENQISYIIDYGWFKDSLKTKEIASKTYSIKQIGYDDDDEGVLVIENDNEKIECVTKISINEIKQLIIELKKIFN